MPTILVDYENVSGSDGLKGVDVLSKNDTLIIFYSKQCEKIRCEYVQKIYVDSLQTKFIVQQLIEDNNYKNIEVIIKKEMF